MVTTSGDAPTGRDLRSLSTRIDRWYVPDIDELIMTAGLTNEFVYKERPSDHMGMWLRVEDRTSKE